MAFNIGLSGIRAASADLKITGNNVANASTTGFKQSRAEFVDVYTSTLLGTGSSPIGSGVLLENVGQQFSQGNISGTENSLDLAIDGRGFFIFDDNGTTSYSRAGIFGLDREGYMTSLNGARVQGYTADDRGIVGGVLGDIQSQATNQNPQQTSLVSSVVNLDSSSLVLAEDGLRITSNGFAVAAAQSGIPDDTESILASTGVPTDPGTPASYGYAFAFPGGSISSTATLSIDLNDGNGIQAIAISTTGVVTASAAAASIQTDIDNVLGQGEINVSYTTAGVISFSRGGLQGTDGSTFSMTTNNQFDLDFSGSTADPSLTPGVAGVALFQSPSFLSADFTSTPGTATTLRTISSPPLTITADVTGTAASLSGSAIGALDFSSTTGGALNFTISINGGAAQTISIAEVGTTGNLTNTTPANIQAVTAAEIEAEIQAQLDLVYPPAGSVVNSSESGGVITFTVTSGNGQPVQVANAASTGPFATDPLGSLGFASANRLASGVADIEANNQFVIETFNSAGSTGGPFTVIIPAATYASYDALALAIQAEINTNIGASGVADQVRVEAVGSQMVFTNATDGSDSYVQLTASGGEPQALASLNFDNMFESRGIDPIDRSNSFVVTLVVPGDSTRSGSLTVSLDEDYRSVQQLAASINRQINAADSDDYIGVQARAVEVQPATSPATYQLEFYATEAGEASIITVNQLIASGGDTSTEAMAALLQVDPDDTSLFTAGIKGVTNGYPDQSVTLNRPDGTTQVISTSAEASAAEVAALLNAQPGVTATAQTTLRIPASGYNNTTNDLFLTVNGQRLDNGTSFSEIVTEIESYGETTLRGITASIDAAGDLVITQATGLDLQVTIDSTNVTDSLMVIGADSGGPVILGGSASADNSAVVGGTATITLSEGYTLSNPEPTVSGLFQALTEDEYEPFLINQFDPIDEETYNWSTAVTIYDSLGNEHVMTQYFVKEPVDALRPNEIIWSMYVLIDGQDVGDPDPSLAFPDNLDATRARFELFYNPDGTLNTDATGDILISNWDPIDPDGNPTGALTSQNVLEGGQIPVPTPNLTSNFQIVMEGSTQHSEASGVNQVIQDGFTTGRLIGLEVNSDGSIFARFNNGQARTLGQVGLATFQNTEGLTPLGDTAWAESFESGNPTIGVARTGTFGQIRSSALEDSNVELSEQLVRLIVAQRNFQASAKTIETADAVTQTIININ